MRKANRTMEAASDTSKAENPSRHSLSRVNWVFFLASNGGEDEWAEENVDTRPTRVKNPLIDFQSEMASSSWATVSTTFLQFNVIDRLTTRKSKEKKWKFFAACGTFTPLHLFRYWKGKHTSSWGWTRGIGSKGNFSPFFRKTLICFSSHFSAPSSSPQFPDKRREKFLVLSTAEGNWSNPKIIRLIATLWPTLNAEAITSSR